jgi:hypothetical protein
MKKAQKELTEALQIYMFRFVLQDILSCSRASLLLSYVLMCFVFANHLLKDWVTRTQILEK